MSEVFDQSLFDRIVGANPDVWAILDELAEIRTSPNEIAGERQLQILLRPHEEVGFRLIKDVVVVRQRQRLDDTLNALTFLEIGCQTGQIDEQVVRQTVPSSFEVLT